MTTWVAAPRASSAGASSKRYSSLPSGVPAPQVHQLSGQRGEAVLEVLLLPALVGGHDLGDVGLARLQHVYQGASPRLVRDAKGVGSVAQLPEALGKCVVGHGVLRQEGS